MNPIQGKKGNLLIIFVAITAGIFLQTTGSLAGITHLQPLPTTGFAPPPPSPIFTVPDVSFATAPFSPIQVGVNPASVAVGDFNGDGIPDLVVANSNDGTIALLLGRGDGSFSNPHSFDVS